MVQAESSKTAERNGLRAVTAGAPADYELPWSVPFSMDVAGTPSWLFTLLLAATGLKSTVQSFSMTLSETQRRWNGWRLLPRMVICLTLLSPACRVLERRPLFCVWRDNYSGMRTRRLFWSWMLVMSEVRLGWFFWGCSWGYWVILIVIHCPGIDVVRNRIKGFAQKKVTLPPGKHKLVILDEADR